MGLGTLYALLVTIIIFGLIYWVVSVIPIPDPFKKVALVVIAVIFLIYMLGVIFGAVPTYPIIRHG